MRMRVILFIMMLMTFSALGGMKTDNIELGTNSPIADWKEAVSEGGGITNGTTNVVFGTITGDGTSVSNVNAVTVGGYTPQQLTAQQVTYYTWGSLAGTYSGSRLVQVASPQGLPPRTNNYTSVTNNQTFSGLCVNTNQNPRILTKGIATIHAYTTRTGNNDTRTLKAKISVYESDLTTLVAEYYSATGDDAIEFCPTNLTHHAINVAITDDIAITDYSRVIVANTMTATGWTGTENVSLYSQNGYLSRLTLAGAIQGIYALSSDLIGVAYQSESNIFTALNQFSSLYASGDIQIGSVHDTNYYSMMRVYVPSNDYDNVNEFGHGLVIDGSPYADKELTWMDNGNLKWGLYTYRNTAGAYLNLFNYKGQFDMLTFYQTGKMGINVPSDYPNYHVQFDGVGKNDMELDTQSPYLRFYKLFYRVTITAPGITDTFLVENSVDKITWVPQGTYLVDNLAPMPIGNGLQIIWASKTGHTLNDMWQFSGHPIAPTASLSVRTPLIPEIQLQTNMNVFSFEDYTYDLNTSDGSGDPRPILETGTNSATYIGLLVPIDNLYFLLTQAASNTTIVFEYWDGGSWNLINGAQAYVDGTANMTKSGSVFFDHSLMTDWTKTNITVSDYVDEYYWLRMRSTTSNSVQCIANTIMVHGKYRFAVYDAYNDANPMFSVNADRTVNIGTQVLSEAMISAFNDMVPVVYGNYTNYLTLSNSWYNSVAYNITLSDTQRWNLAYTDLIIETNRARQAEAGLQGQISVLSNNTQSITNSGGTNTTVSGPVEFTVIPTSGGQPLSLAGEPPLYDGIYTKPSVVFDGTNMIAISSGVFSLYTNAAYGGRLISVTIPATNLVLTVTNSFCFVRASYDNGNPLYDLVSTPALINGSSQIQAFTLYLNASTDEKDLYVSGFGDWGKGSISKTENRFVAIDGYKRHLGLALSAGAGLDYDLTAGYVWYGLEYINTPPMNSLTTDVDVWIHSNGVWTTIQTNQMMNGYYDNGTNIVAATPGKYTINWVYVTPHKTGGTHPNEFYVVLGNTEYNNLALAEAAQPADVPLYISYNSLLVGLLATGSDSNTIEGVVSAFQSTFQGVVINDHNNLSGLQGSAPFIHLGTDEYNGLTTAISQTPTWNEMSSWVSLYSNSLLYVLGQTGVWNQASIDSIFATNVLHSYTQLWMQASVDAIDATNRVKAIEARTNAWNLATLMGLQDTLNNGSTATNNSMQVGRWALGLASTFPAMYSPSNAGMIIGSSPALADIANWPSIYLYPTGTPAIIFNTGLLATNGILQLQIAGVDKLTISGESVNYFAPLNLSAGVVSSTPESGHLKIYLDNTSGFERPYFIDSRGNKVRIGRDSVWTVYNAEANTLQHGELIYLVPGLFGTATQWAKRAIATNKSTCAFAYVVAEGGIASGDRGLVNRFGRIEDGIDTSMYPQNAWLYLSDKVAGAVTNIAPDISQFVGYNQISSTNGSVNIEIHQPEMMGDMTPSMIDARIGGLEVRSNAWNQAVINGSNSWVWIGLNSNKVAGAVTNNQSGVNFGSLTVGGNTVVTNPVAGRITASDTNAWWAAYAASTNTAVIGGSAPGFIYADANTNLSYMMALTNGTAGTWTNLSRYYNDAGFVSNGQSGVNFGSLTVGGNTVLTNIPSYYLTNNQSSVNFGSLTVNGNNVLTNYVDTTFTNWVDVAGGLLTLTGGNRSGSNVVNLTTGSLATAMSAYGFTTNSQPNVNFGTNLQVAGVAVVTNPVAANITSIMTDNWSTAYVTIGNTVTNSWGFNEPTPTAVAPNDIYLSSEFYKARNWVEFHAMTEAGTVYGQIILRNSKSPIRTYTVVTNFIATTTSTNATTILASTIPAGNEIGIVVTNVLPSTTNLWISLDYATTNGMRDL